MNATATHITRLENATVCNESGSHVANVIEYDYAAIARALCAHGATEAEAEALTDILHEEGWGGTEALEDGQAARDFSDFELEVAIAWYRENRGPGADFS